MRNPGRGIKFWFCAIFGTIGSFLVPAVAVVVLSIL